MYPMGICKTHIFTALFSSGTTSAKKQTPDPSGSEKGKIMIYCVEDDRSIRELIIYTLEAAGYTAKGFESGSGFFAALHSNMPELVLLDLMLPEEDGLSILKKLRSGDETSDIPVMIATAKGTELDKVTGLDLGADDYLVKPFGMMEMISHIRAVLRRCRPLHKQPALSDDLHIAGIEIDPGKHTVTADGKEIHLTLKEYELLRTFIMNKGKALTREQLFEQVWGSGPAGETRTVDVHVGTLRTKLGNYGSLIRTVRGVGYRMESR